MDRNQDQSSADQRDSVDGGKRALVLKIGDEHYGLLLDKVVEVFEASMSLMRVPGSPEWLSGLVNNHGQVVPVISLSSFWDIGSRQPSNHIVLVEFENEQFGLAVNKIESLDKVWAEGPEIQGRRRCWYRGALLELIDPSFLMKEIHNRLTSKEVNSSCN